MEISNTSTVPMTMTPQTAEMDTEMAQTVATVVTETLGPILRNGLSVSTTAVKGANGVGESREVEAPELDEAAEGANEVDLEKLLAYLMLESDEEQMKAAEQRLKAQIEKLDKEQKKLLQKISEAVEEAQRQIEAQKKNEIFGWIMMALTVVATAITVAITLGAATPLAIAGCALAVAGCALSVTNQILTATGVMEKRCKERAEELMRDNPEMSRKDAMAKAQKEWQLGFGITTAIIGVAALGVGIASIATSAANTAKTVAETAEKAAEVAEKASNTTSLVKAFSDATFQMAAKIAAAVMGLASSGLSIATVVNSFKIAELMKQYQENEAEIQELQAFLDTIKKILEDEEELVQDLIAKIQGVFTFVSNLVSEETDSVDEILNNMMNGGNV